MEVSMSESFVLLMYCISNLLLLSFFDFKLFLNKKECFALSLLFILTMFFLLIHLPLMLSFAIYLLGVILNFYFYFRTLQSWIVPTLLISLKYVLLILSWFITFDLPGILLGEEFFHVFWIMLSFHIVQQWILILAILFVNKLFAKYNVYYSLYIVKKEHRLLSVIYILFSAVLIFVRHFRSYPDYTELFMLSVFMLSASLFMIFLLIGKVSAKQYEITQTHLRQQVQSFEKENTEQIENFQHDYKNTLLVLSEYLNQEQYEEGKHYLNELIHYSKDVLTPYHFSDIYKIPNLEIQNYFLNYFAKCTDNHIDAKLLVTGKPYLLQINPIDITRIISIITNNAFEACKANNFSSIDISFEYLSQEAIITVSNPFIESLSIHSITEKNFTTKPGHSGRGLFILKSILNQNDSSYDITYYDKCFSISITIPISSKNTDYKS